MTLEEAVERAQNLSELHDTVEEKLLAFEVLKLTRDLSTGEAKDCRALWTMHDRLEREILAAYAQLHAIDPAACARLRNGEEP